MSDVLFAPLSFSRYDADQTLPAKFTRLLQKSGLAAVVGGKSVAIKMHIGDKLSYSTIPPVFVRLLVQFIKENGGDCFVCDHAIQHRHPENRGYVESILGCPVLDVCGHLDKYFYTKTVSLHTFSHVDIAGYIQDADVLIDFSHVKGHGACGYGGACKNIAMGCVTTRTRRELHRLEGGLRWDDEPGRCIRCGQCIDACNHNANAFREDKYSVNYHDCTLCQHCAKVCPTGAISFDEGSYENFQQGMALCTKTVLDTFAPGHTYFINVLTQITLLCDCWGMTTPSLVPDIGIMASNDIVALERACLDAIRTEDLIPAGLPEGHILGGSGHLFERVHGKDPFIQVRALERYGLGTQAYNLQTIR